MSTKQEKQRNLKALSRRFSCEDWQRLCGNQRFLDAAESGEIERAEVIAHEILDVKI